jgi:sulfate adenylyltransferase
LRTHWLKRARSGGWVFAVSRARSIRETEKDLRSMDLPRRPQGLTIFLTGLSGAGKTSIAEVLFAKFLERGDREVSVLDGDVVRKQFSSHLGFSKEHRNLHIRRIGMMASEVVKDGGVAVCAVIAPYDGARKEVRALIEGAGAGFVLVHVATPLAVCELRDCKGLYAKARAGVIAHFTGISDPYEAPLDAELAIDTSHGSPEDAAEQITRYLEREGFLISMESPHSPELAELAPAPKARAACQ